MVALGIGVFCSALFIKGLELPLPLTGPWLSTAYTMFCRWPPLGWLACLREAEARWADRGFTDYSIESRSGCFCPPEVSAWVRIDVMNGEVIRATVLENGEVITDTRLSSRHGRGLFDSSPRVERPGLPLGRHGGVRWRPRLPTHVAWIPDGSCSGCRWMRELRNATPLLAPN